MSRSGSATREGASTVTDERQERALLGHGGQPPEHPARGPHRRRRPRGRGAHRLRRRRRRGACAGPRPRRRLPRRPPRRPLPRPPSRPLPRLPRGAAVRVTATPAPTAPPVEADAGMLAADGDPKRGGCGRHFVLGPPRQPRPLQRRAPRHHVAGLRQCRTAEPAGRAEVGHSGAGDHLGDLAGRPALHLHHARRCAVPRRQGDDLRRRRDVAAPPHGARRVRLG